MRNWYDKLENHWDVPNRMFVLSERGSDIKVSIKKPKPDKGLDLLLLLAS